MRRVHCVIVLGAILGLLAVVPAGAHDTTGKSTVDQTIVPVNGAGFKFLTLGPGEPYVVRTDLVGGHAQRANRRKSLVYFGQITDWQLPDEESPAREERFDSDPFARASTSGYRPQEPLAIHAVEATVRQMNLFLTSPVPQGDGSRAQLANAVMTGDLADSMQRNETTWVRDLLEGGIQINPGSGTTDLTGTHCAGMDPSLISDFDDPSRYTGVGDYDDYAVDSFMYYDPESPAGSYATNGWPTYPNLFDRAQAPFAAEGLRVPTYVAFGNHDALYQGTVSAGPGLVVPAISFEDIAVDCLKLVYPLANEQTLGPPPNPEDMLAGLSTGKTTLVPPDQQRQFVDKHQFKDIFRDGRQADDHGFAFIDPAERAASSDQASYYSWSPKPGLRFIVLDTVSESGLLVSPGRNGQPVGGQEGNIDHPQWLWLNRELDRAQAANDLIVLFGHHNIKTLTQNTADEVSPCTGEQRFGHDRFNPSCDRDPRSSTPLHDGQEFRDLLFAHRNAIAYVAGHTHENEIVPYGGQGGGFWEITSPATADWPPQHRVIDVMDNRDGTLSLFATILDHDSPSQAPPSGTDASGFGIGELASIGRTITFNDPQEGPDGSEGLPIDRNAELLIANPRCRTLPGVKPPKGCKPPGG